MKKYEKWFAIHKNQIVIYSILGLILIILTAIFFRYVKFIVALVLIIFANIMLRFYKRIFPGLPIEFEVTLLGTICMSITHGIWAGIITAIFTSIFAEFFNQFISPFSLVNILIYALVPLIAIFIPAGSVVGLGFALVILANIVIFIVFTLLGYDLFKNAAYGITNLIFNYFTFTYLAIHIIQIMK